jgi:DNA-binding winged helix-turn-helix (wHTH) protein/predicted ATPase
VVFVFENLALDIERRELTRGSRQVAIGPQVFDLLVYLLRNRERVVSKDDLIQGVWNGRIVSESTLASHINAVRKAVDDSGEEQRLIRTIHRKGFRFVGEVKEELRAGDGAAAAVEGPVRDLRAPVPERPPTAERRQLTVVSCELLLGQGAARMDPEDLRDVVRAYHGCVSETAARFNGMIGDTFGNAVFVHFGYPAAHEDDAEQAVRCGLELCAAVTRIAVVAGLETRAPLQTRVGIATGVVVASDPTGAAGARERGIIGETPNLAARLQGIAEPNTVVIAEGTRRLLGDLFELQDLGAREFKGTTRPVRAWAVLQASSVESRFEALHASNLTALVGREEESELLLRRWLRAKAGQGQVVLLSGEAGIGKSRLTAALSERLASELHARLRYFCSPQHTDSAFYPIIGQIERAVGMGHDDTPQTRLDKLDGIFMQTSTSIEDAALFADMLSLPNDGRYPALDLDPQQRRQRTLGAVLSHIEALARQGLVLMSFEDVHWIDPTSLELLGRAVDRIRSLRVLLVVTFRPEFAPPWIGRPHVTALTINRLAEREVAVMIDQVVGDKLLPASIRQDIIERTDGIPLFVEEMTKAVLEAEGEGEARRTVAAVPFPALAIPASLHASLMARLDRLGTAKEVAQIGAAIGREFSYALLAAVVRQPVAEMGSALDRLVQAGLLFRQGEPPHATYLFKHALVQEAAYGTLLREPRRTLHARIAEALESQFADIAQSQPELLARHCTEAGQIEKAAGLWANAGQRSLERSALVEAAEQLTRALAQIAVLPATPALRREQIKLQVTLIAPLIDVKGFAAPETKAAAERARLLIEQAEALGEPPEDPLLLIYVLYGFWVANLGAFNGDVIRDLAAHFLALAEKQGATIPLMIGHRLMGVSLLCTGDIAQGRAHLDRAIALYDPAEHRPLATRFGHDTGVVVLTFRSWALWLLGYPRAALRDADDALKNAREMGRAATLMHALSRIGTLDILCGNYSVATARTSELFALAEEKGALFWKAGGMALQGCALTLTGKASDAVHMIPSAITTFRSMGVTLFVPLYLSHLARAYVELRKIDDAWRCIGEAMTAVETTKERWCEADIHRIAGEIALLSPEPDAAKAQAYFDRALAVAREQEAKSWELRAAMSMARLWRAQGKRQQARELLAPVYGWFTEGFDTPDLKEARALLDTLA